MEANDIKRHTHRDHIYHIPDTYIGDSTPSKHEERLFDNKLKIFKVDEISYITGIERLFLEIISNAGDNVQLTRELNNQGHNFDIGKIVVDIDNNRVKVTNYGKPIPVEINTNEQVYAPEMIFGILLTSTNYDQSKDRIVGGRNGYGAKLTNIFSKKFEVTVGDNVRGKHYYQYWTDNMSNRSDPAIDYNYSGDNFVTVEYILDFERFELTEYSNELIQLFSRHAIDLSFSCQVPVVLNDVQYNPDQYHKLLWPDTNTTCVSIDNHKVILADTPDKGTAYSFVNGINTKEGGVHVDALYRELAKQIIKPINEKEKSEHRLKPKDLKDHLSVLLSSNVINPKFNSQMKYKLTAPSPTIKIPDISSIVRRWSLNKRLRAALDAKCMKTLKKTDGRKNKWSNVSKLEDANKAGEAHPNECYLYLVEGDSAKSYAVKLISEIPNGRDYCGIYALRGKILNVTNANNMMLANNKQYIEVKQAMGLEEEVDYSNDAYYHRLRYGHVVILTDQDLDGMHIRGLVINLFHRKFPGLLDRGALHIFQTPIIRAVKGKTMTPFYNIEDFHNWRDSLDNKQLSRYQIRYYKGLGSSSDSDISNDHKSGHLITVLKDQYSDDMMKLAFDNTMADDRKAWFQSSPDYSDHTIVEQSITDFLQSDFLRFSLYNLSRMIPSLDGLKTSQRKIVWGSILYWKEKVGSKVKAIRTSQLVSIISERTDYHHGEKSLGETINGMVSSFAGRNNLPYFDEEGQFGSRNMEGKDAGEMRYTGARPKWWWPYIFKTVDKNLLTIQKSEDMDIEPKFMLPIIPLMLVNGSLGIGSGYSTFIPNHNPIDVINWLTAKLTEQPLPEVRPWYQHFQGTIELKEKNLTPDNDTDIALVAGKQLSMIVTGKFEIIRKRTRAGKTTHDIRITEIPFGRSFFRYLQWLEVQRQLKNLSGYENHCKANIPEFLIKGFKPKPTARNLYIQRSFGLTNMVILDPNTGVALRYKHVQDILESFYQWRLPYYQQRKELQVSSLEKELTNEKQRLALIKAINNGTLKPASMSKQQLLDNAEQLGIDSKLVTNMRVVSQVKDNVSKQEEVINNLVKRLKETEQQSDKEMWLNDLNQLANKIK